MGAQVLRSRCVSGVYELATFLMHPGGPAVWGRDFQAAIMAHDAPGYGHLVAAFHSEVGPLNTGSAALLHTSWWSP